MPTEALKIESLYVGRLVRDELMRVIFPPFEIYEYFQLLSFLWIFLVVSVQKYEDDGLPPNSTPR